MRQGKLIAGMLLSLSAAIAITGCFTGGVNQISNHESLATDLTAEEAPRVARLQQMDPPDPKFRPLMAPPLHRSRQRCSRPPRGEPASRPGHFYRRRCPRPGTRPCRLQPRFMPSRDRGDVRAFASTARPIGCDALHATRHDHRSGRLRLNSVARGHAGKRKGYGRWGRSARAGG